MAKLSSSRSSTSSLRLLYRSFLGGRNYRGDHWSIARGLSPDLYCVERHRNQAQIMSPFVIGHPMIVPVATVSSTGLLVHRGKHFLPLPLSRQSVYFVHYFVLFIKKKCYQMGRHRAIFCSILRSVMVVDCFNRFLRARVLYPVLCETPDFILVSQ